MLARTIELIGTSGFVALLILTILASIILRAVLNYRKLCRFPGPPLAACTRLWLFRQWLSSRVHFAHEEALKTYGSPSRVAPDLLITDDADVVRHVSSSRSGWMRSRWYDTNAFDARQHTVFTTRDEKIHAELRAKEIGAYTGRDLELEAGIDTTILELIALISNSYSRRPLDLSQVTRYFALDTLSRLLYSESFGNLKADKDVFQFGDSVASMLPIAELIQNHEWIFKVVTSPVLRKLLNSKAANEIGANKIVSLAREHVRERFVKGQRDHKDILGYFMRKDLSQLQCEVEAALQIFAGSDSTATVLRNTMFLSISNPAAYGKLRAEVDNAVTSGHISSPVAKYEETKKLPYLQACIWEGMRMYPPLFGLKTKVAPLEGDTIKGVFYPGGVELGFCDSAMCRKESEWGSDADQYRPDRWIEAKEEALQRYEMVVGCIFGSGKYTCLGKHIAFMELHKVVFELMRHFDFAITDPMHGITMYGHTAWVQKNMFVTPYPRRGKVEQNS
ncbi:Pisatin demethylase [Cyphellophora attinorum]|uniref:Pisatin demethylase n=1 Tax=Cyphellophora attinorum TaxID=1664694 RepID=A0A0N0NMT1_9EURO|nr:Pisatin demethylase [Phialophora attinorum]KPI40708.1 Pisatin demethylase [Phialophora attinorum]